MAKKIKPRKTRQERKAERQQQAEERARQAAGIQDEFQAKGFELVEWIQEKRHWVLGAIAAIIIAGAAVGSYTLISSQENLKASALYREALEAFQGQVGDPLPGLEDDGPRFKDATERAQKARELFQKVIDQQGRSEVATLAWLYVGHTSLQLDEAERAVEAYDRFLARAKKTSPLYFAGLEGKAIALEAKGDIDGAIHVYEEHLTLPISVGKDAALLALGRLYDKKGNAQKAREVLERLVKDHPDSPLKAEADDLLARLSA